MTVPSDSPSSSSSSCDAHVMTSTELPSFPEVIKQQITSSGSAPPSPTSTKSKSISDSTETTSHDSKANYAFLSDAEIGASRIFRLVCMFQYFMCRYFHSYSIQGLEKVDPTRGALFYTMHTTHSADIFATLCTIFIVTGRVGRSLIHRWIMLSYPFLKYFGSVAGERNAAHQLLTKGYWTAVIPGGAPEAMAGHEHAYELRWGERAGFAAVAMKAGVPLYPTFTVNMEEMRFNPVFFIWNQLNLFKPYDWIIKRDIPYITRTIYYIAMGVWWTCSFICIPVPVPVKLVIGDAVDYTADEDVAVVAQRAQVALQSLIDQHQGRRHLDHIAALRMRFNEQQLRYIAGIYVAIVAMFCMIVARFYW